MAIVLIWKTPPERARESYTWVYPEFSSCEKEVSEQIHLDQNNVLLLQNIASLCFTKLQDQSYISIFEVNRAKYVEQNYEDRVLLWMVVTITVAGVFLSGFQLWISFNIASTQHTELAKENEITLETGRLSLRSSVTGLAILFLSFGFFIVYVKYVYKIDNDSGAPAPLAGQIVPGLTTLQTSQALLRAPPPLPQKKVDEATIPSPTPTASHVDK